MSGPMASSKSGWTNSPTRGQTVRVVTDAFSAGLNPDVNVEALALTILTLRTTSILATRSSESARMAKEVMRKTGIPSTARKAMELMLTRTPLDRSGALSVDFCVADATNWTSVIDSCIGGEYQASLDAVRRCPAAGTAREVAFDAILKRHCAASSHIAVFDRYLGSALVQEGPNSGAAWALARICSETESDFEIMTAMENGVTADEVAAALGRFVPIGKRAVQLCVSPFGSLMHDRHLRFVFGNGRGSEAITIGQGLQVFRERVIGQMATVAVISGKDASEREADFRSRRYWEMGLATPG